MRLIIHKNPQPENYVTSFLFLKENIEWIMSIGEIDNEKIDFVNLAKKNKHIASIGFLGLSEFGAIAQYGYGIKYSEIGKILYKIFVDKETATLFPSHNLTIIPFDLNPDYYLNNIKDAKKHNSLDKMGYSRDEIESFIEDCFKAEIEIINSGEIYFHFKDLGFDAIDYYYSVLQFVFKNKHINLKIHVESVNNIEFMSDVQLSSLETRQTTRNFRLSHKRTINTWKKIEEDNKLTSWYQRGLRRKKAIQEFRSINKIEREKIRNNLKKEFNNLTTIQKVIMIINDKKFPPEYYPIEWSAEILIDYNIIPVEIKQELYNKLSIKVFNSNWKLLSTKLKKDKDIK